MKKNILIVLFGIMLFGFIPNVYADRFELCPTQPEGEDCTWIKSSGHTANGESYLYVIVWESSTITLNGTNTYSQLEFSDNTTLTIKGTGTLKFKWLGLSLAGYDYITPSNFDETILKKYLKGNYTYTNDGTYITVSLQSPTTTTAKATTTTMTTTKSSSGGTTASYDKTTTTSTETDVYELENGNVTFKATTSLKNLTLQVNKLDITEEIKKLIDSNLDIVDYYDISLIDENGDILEAKDGEFTIRIKLDDIDVNANYKVYYIVDNTIKETFDATVVADELEFETSHLSNYLIALENDSSEIDEDMMVEASQDSGILVPILVIIFGLIVIVLAALIIKKKKKAKKN